MKPSPIKLTQFISGIKTGSPIAIGYIPIAIAFGALAVKAQMTVEEAVMMSVFVFAGASQFMAASMILAGVGPAQIIATTFFVNLRHLIMSMSVNEEFKDFSKPWRIGLSFGITDETFALLTLQSQGDKQAASTPIFSAGLMGIAYLGWVSGTALGGLGARVIPPTISAGMTVGLYAMFIGLLVPHVRQSLKIGAVALLSMFLNAVFQSFLEAGWAIVLATILGALFGSFIIKGEA